MSVISDISPPNSQHTIRLEDVSKTFGTATALSPMNLTVLKGEFLTLLGPSGSGKSTLLNLISGSLSPTTGRIHLDGRDITHTPPRERGIGMVFQNYALMPHMTVFNNVAYPLHVRGVAKDEIRRRVGEALARVGLTGFESRKPRQLSGGQQQRVGIARCIVYSPAIIMMDEPLGALDKNLREQMQDEIKRLHRDLGTTFIYVTHDQEEALNISDRICLMSNGGIAQLGTPDELYFAPANRFVAEFVGESNLFSGIVKGQDRMATASDRELAVPIGPSRKIGDAIEVMVRPEKVQVAPETGKATAEPGFNIVSGTVKSVSFVGSMTRVLATLGDDISVTAKVISGRAGTHFKPGDQVRLSWNITDAVVLEASSPTRSVEIDH